MIISTMVDVYVVYYPIILSFIWASGAFLSRWKERDKKAIGETKEFEKISIVILHTMKKKRLRKFYYHYVI